MIVNIGGGIQCEELCKIIQRVIARHFKETGSNAKALSINVVSEIIEIEPNTHKLEHKDV